MELKDKYRFNDFTLSNYRRLLRLALNNYSFKAFNEDFINDKNIILLRHDIEFSIPIALRMAQIEAELGIKSTYLLQIHSEFYNALEKANQLMVNQILDLGHNIGLHFDTHYWDITQEDRLEECLLIDKNTLEMYYGITVDVFSFHNTNPFILSCEKEKYSGIINTYSKKLKESAGYCADSTGYWRYEVLEERLKVANDNQLQVLIHDGMWQDEVLSPRKRVFKVIDDNAQLLKISYDETLKRFEAKNIDWDKIY